MFELGVTTPCAAVQVMCTLLPGFREELSKGAYRVRRGSRRKGVDLTARTLPVRLGPDGHLHIIPVAQGAKGGGGIGKIIVGVVLVVIAIVATIYTGGAAAPAFGAGADAGGGLATGAAAGTGLSTVLFAGVTTGDLMLAGAALILTGIGTLLSPQAKLDANRPSALLGGAVNVAAQGVPVPLVYGTKVRVGSVVASLSYEAEDWGTTASISDTGPFGTSINISTLTGPSGGGANPGGGGIPSLPPYDQGGYVGQGFSGGGGGGGGKGVGGSVGSPNEDPNTLRSNATVRIIDVLGEGPIGGLVAGATSVYFNNTPLMDLSGHWNFAGVSMQQFYGTPDQSPVSGFASATDSMQVGLQCFQATPITQTIESTSANAARVTIQIPALYHVDPSTNFVGVTSLQYNIDVQSAKAGPGGWLGAWTNVATVTISNGKTMSPYQRSHRFDLPDRELGADTWSVRLTRITPDSIANQPETAYQYSSYDVNDLWWLILDVITDHQLIYPNTAYVALTFDAWAFGSTVPTRAYDIGGMQVAVPANYDAATRTYSTSGVGTTGGTWDLVTTQLASTDNPAWILLDLLENARYGVGIPAQYLEATKADLYTIAQWCDGMVDDGYGTLEARYTVNAALTGQDDAYRVLQLVTAAFRGMTYWGAGQVRVSADMPKTPIKLVNQTNTQGGLIDYQSTSLKTRHNFFRVSYLDETNQYQVTVEPVMDALDIAKRGVYPSDLVAWGCVSRGAAHRLGKWQLWTEANQTETASFHGANYLIDLRPGDIFKVADPTYIGARTAGRLRSATVPVGGQLIANSIDPVGAAILTDPAPPNTVGGAGSGAPAAFYHGTAVVEHTRNGTGDDNVGTISITGMAAGEYTCSCYVWLPGSFSGTSLIITSGADETASQIIGMSGETVTADGLQTPGNAITEANLTAIGINPGLPPNQANQGTIGAWQRIWTVMNLTAAGTVYAILRANVPSGTVFYSTCWQIEPGNTPGDYVPLSGGLVQIRQLLLDQVFAQDGSTNYWISVVLPNNTLADMVVVDTFADAGATPDYTIAKLATALPMPPAANAEWIITSQQQEPRQFQLLELAETHPGQFAASAINYDPNKYTEIEQGITFTSTPFTTLPKVLAAALQPPSNVMARDYTVTNGATQVLRTTVSWTAASDPRILRYEVLASGAGYYKIFEVYQAASYDIDGLPPNVTYTFAVRSIGGSAAQASVWVPSAPLLVNGKVAPPIAVLGLGAIGGVRSVFLSWQSVPNRSDIAYYEVWRGSSVAFAPGTGGTLVAQASTNAYTDSDASVLQPDTIWYYWIRAVAFGPTLLPGAFAGPVGATTSLLIASDLAAGIIGTAQFARSINAPRLITSTAATVDIDGNGFSNGQYATSEADNKLYQWVVTGGVGAWETSVLGTNAVIAGTVAASAIGATEIAAGSIETLHLATSFQLTSTAQIGNAIITNAQIANLTVQTSNIAAGAVSDASLVQVAYNGAIGTYYESGISDTWTTMATVSVYVPDASSRVALFIATSLTTTAPSYSGGYGGG